MIGTPHTMGVWAVANMTGGAKALRAEVEAAVLKAAERVGLDGISQAAIVKQFAGKAAQSTLFRWIDTFIRSGKPGQHVARQVKRAAERREKQEGGPSAAAAAIAADAAEALPVVLTVDDVLGSGSTTRTVNVLERLQQLAGDLELLVRHAKTDDGKVRNARLLLQATGEFRKLLETAARIHATMREADHVDRLHDAILEVIAECDPALAERVLRRMDAVAQAWLP